MTCREKGQLDMNSWTVPEVLATCTFALRIEAGLSWLSLNF